MNNSKITNSYLTQEAKTDIKNLLDLEGSGGGGGDDSSIFVVTFKYEVINGYDEVVTDKTYSEIKDAYDNGKLILANIETQPLINGVKVFMYYWSNNGFGADYIQPAVLDPGTLNPPYSGIGSGIIAHRLFITTADSIYVSSRTFSLS